MALDRIEAMRAFCRIVELGSFNRAADALNTATTTISGQVQALERQLAVKLLHRSTRKVHPTPEGVLYYQRARSLIEAMDDLEASMSSSLRAVKGRIAVEMPTPVGLHLVIPGLPDFMAQHPDVHLDIGCSERVTGLVAEGVDCAIRGGEIADQDLVAKPLGAMQFCLCAAPHYLHGRPALQHPDDLLQHQWLGFKFPGTHKRFIPQLFQGSQSHAVHQPPHILFNNGTAVAVSAAQGLGIAALPRAVVAQQLASGALVEVMPAWRVRSMPMSIVYPPTRQLSARVQVFVDWVTARFAADPLWASQARADTSIHTMTVRSGAT